MKRTSMTLTLSKEEYELLKRFAEQERIMPATLATRLLGAALRKSANAHESSDPMDKLYRWLAPHLDRLRDAGGWSESVTIDIFEMIEKEAAELYEAAVDSLGQRVVNQSLGRFIRIRLDAELVQRGGRPLVARAPRGRTRLLASFTHLKPAQESR